MNIIKTKKSGSLADCTWGIPVANLEDIQIKPMAPQMAAMGSADLKLILMF